jgi:hypothetical protein
MTYTSVRNKLYKQLSFHDLKLKSVYVKVCFYFKIIQQHSRHGSRDWKHPNAKRAGAAGPNTSGTSRDAVDSRSKVRLDEVFMSSAISSITSPDHKQQLVQRQD